MAGIKNDKGKPNYTHIPKHAMDAMGEAFNYGANKYSADNYREGMHVRRSIAAALRHIYQFLDEGDIDAESGCEHIGCALASLAMAAYTVKNRPEFDDRYRPKKVTSISSGKNQITRSQQRTPTIAKKGKRP